MDAGWSVPVPCWELVVGVGVGRCCWSWFRRDLVAHVGPQATGERLWGTCVVQIISSMISACFVLRRRVLDAIIASQQIPNHVVDSTMIPPHASALHSLLLPLRGNSLSLCNWVVSAFLVLPLVSRLSSSSSRAFLRVGAISLASNL